MLLKRLRLKNIRTYEDWEVVLPRGSILFEGGIGSGKSTLLLAIEFALFGLGNEKGTTLLSIGKNHGEVELDIEASGKEVRLHRSLVRSRKGGVNHGAMVPAGVKQDECWLEYDGRRWVYSPKEMKEAVLKILGYNEPQDPKAKSVIFRYAVYTPQEEMKEILAQAPDGRLQTIRKALRLEEYKVAQENAQNVAKDLSSRVKPLLEEAKKLPTIREGIKQAEAKLPGLKESVSKTEEEMMDAEIAIRGHKAVREDLRKKLEGLAVEARREQELSSALRELERRMAGFTAATKANREKVAALRKRVDEANTSLERPSTDFSEVNDSLQRAKGALAQEMEMQGKLAQIHRSLASLVERRVCPTCNQPVDNEEFKSKLKAARLELDASIARRSALEKEVGKLEGLSKASMMYESAISSISEQQERIYDMEHQISTDGEELSRLEAQQPELETRIREAAEAAAAYEMANEEFRKNESEIASLERRANQLKESKVNDQLELARIEMQLEELRDRMAGLESYQDRAERLKEYVSWLVEYFVPALSRMELTILTSTNREFDEEFGRWFSFLVEDSTKGVRVDEGFTPSVTQDSYEQEVGNLSGGERTALALAYRLALNKTVQRRAGVDSGLLILDEPTDGFSKDQIGKIGDLLKELDLRQAIIVSHERELEGAVDHIFRVSKEDGRSRVQPINS
jgi:exonuclease SbcC